MDSETITIVLVMLRCGDFAYLGRVVPHLRISITVSIDEAKLKNRDSVWTIGI